MQRAVAHRASGQFPIIFHPAGWNMNLFGPMIKRLKVSSVVCVCVCVCVCMGHTVNASMIYSQEKLEEDCRTFWVEKTKKHCLIVCLLVALEFDMSLSTNTVAFYDWPYPPAKPFPVHFSQAVCQPVWKRLLWLCRTWDLKYTIHLRPPTHRCCATTVERLILAFRGERPKTASLGPLFVEMFVPCCFKDEWKTQLKRPALPWWF